MYRTMMLIIIAILCHRLIDNYAATKLFGRPLCTKFT